ncbi:MAG: discoidin domain-containing protein [Myxococcaceae bacterium]|nr:discoidin domain-containing protein [Myxococcaceae bacterium]
MIRAITLAVLVALPAFAGPIGYAQATGYFKKDSRPTLYQPLNLLDGRDNTAWCSPTADTLNDHLTFGFKTVEKIEELRISTGNNFSAETWNQFGRAKKLELKTKKGSKAFEVKDERGTQVITFDPPLEGTYFTLEVLDQYPADDPDSPVCLTDVIFVAGGKPTSGAYLGTKLKYDKQTAAVMGTWFAGYPDKPDRFLSFFLDGTFRYSYEPYDTAKYQPKDVTGDYDASPGRLTFQIGKAKKSAKMNLDADTKSSRGGHLLVFEGDLPDDLKQQFRSVP